MGQEVELGGCVRNYAVLVGVLWNVYVMLCCQDRSSSMAVVGIIIIVRVESVFAFVLVIYGYAMSCYVGSYSW